MVSNNKVSDESSPPAPANKEDPQEDEKWCGCFPKSKKEPEPEEEKEPEPDRVGFFELYRDATPFEYTLLAIGVTAAVIHGAALPLLFVWMGDLTDNFIVSAKAEACNFDVAQCAALADQTGDESFRLTAEAITKAQDIVGSNMLVIYLMVGFGFLALIAGSIHAGLFSIVASRISERCRKRFFEKLISQEMAFYDVESSPGELTIKIVDDLDQMRNGMGDKVSQTIQFLSQAVSGFVIGFKFSWALTLAILGGIPFLIIITVIGMKAGSEMATDEKKLYGSAADTANEVLISIQLSQLLVCKN